MQVLHATGQLKRNKCAILYGMMDDLGVGDYNFTLRAHTTCTHSRRTLVSAHTHATFSLDAVVLMTQ